MESHEFVDFISLLPKEIAEKILCQLIEDDSKFFTNCRLVSKNWNERISYNPHMWKIACEKLEGLNVKKAPDTEVDCMSVLLRMRKRFQQMKNGRDFFVVDSINLNLFSQCKYNYHNGIVATVDKDSIHIFKLEPKLEVVSRIRRKKRKYANCVHFDHSYLVVGCYGGYVTTYEMPTMKMMHTKMSPSCEMCCITFNKDIDLLVTTSDDSATFWCLSTGTIHCTRTISHSLIGDGGLHLISTPDLQNGCDYMLLCVCSNASYKFCFDSQNINTANMDPVRLYKIKYEYTSGTVYSTSRFLYVMHGLDSGISTLVKCDPVSGKLEVIRRFNCVDMRLVGAGRKYVCLLHSIKQKFIIYDLATKSVFSSFVIPGVSGTIASCLDNASWLDGFDGFNDKGILFVFEDKNRRLSVIKWRNMI